ncbi:Gfo/Idh/MocA family oxidoreductase [Paenibacillus sp. FSL L8-0470]|uniref:Gfo/Idh/MocA family protein n=1 Tax=Paenibacillus sp. FSL L8-0470 TaxID=2954688 RepID=UPI0030F4E82D
MRTEGGAHSYRLGILGASNIVRPALLEPARYVDDITVSAIANRTPEKAMELAHAYNIPQVAGSLEALLEMKELDAVYIALSNDLHAEWALKALAAGKHVLVEKPIALTPAEAEQLGTAAAQPAAPKLVEGLMVAHHPWQQALKSIIDSGQYGQLRSLKTRITIPAKDQHSGNYRSIKSKGGGAFADLGCYWLQFVANIEGLQHVQISGQSQFDGPDGCDWTFQAALKYDSGLDTECLISFELPYRASHTLYFDQTVLTVPDFLRPLKGFYPMKIRHDLPDDRSTVQNFEPMNYYVNQLRAFAEIMDGTREAGLERSLERVTLQARMMAVAQQAWSYR